MRLPYGRRLVCYWMREWRPTLPRLVRRLGHAWFVHLGPVRIVLYAGRMDWTDLDRKVEASYQRRQG